MGAGMGAAWCLLLLPLSCAAIRFDGEGREAKPPPRQELLLPPTIRERPQQQGPRFEKGARPTVASRPYWITTTTYHGHRPSDTAPAAGPSGDHGQWRPPTVAPLPPHAKTDLLLEASARKTTAAPAGAPGPKRPQQQTEAGTALDEGVAEDFGTTGCTGRGHSWGCGPFGPGRSDGGGGHPAVPGETGPLAAAVALRTDFEERNIGLKEEEGLGRRGTLAFTGRARGWVAPKDWCLLPTGQFPYPLDCRRFVNCWNGNGFIQPCAPGTLFNADTLECDFPSKVRGCQQGGHPQWSSGQPQHGPRETGDQLEAASGKLVSGVEEAEEEGSKEYGEGMIDVRGSVSDQDGGVEDGQESGEVDTTTTTPKTITTRRPRVFQSKMFCPEENGIFPHPEFCDRFVNCHAGRPHAMMCGPGTLYDAVNKRCDHARNVRCPLDRPHGEWEEEELTPSESRSHSIAVDPSPPSTPPPSRWRPTLTSPRVVTTTVAAPLGGPVGRRPPPAPVTTAPHHDASPTRHATSPWEVRSLWSPPTGQSIRLRGGSGPWEGFLEAHVGGGKWKPVCDHSDHWTLAEGSVVCRQLGHHRGAEMTWQGDWTAAANASADHGAATQKVECRGHEGSLAACRLDTVAGQCDLGSDTVAVRCLREYRSLCSVHEVPFGGHCYSLVLPDEASSGVKGQPHHHPPPSLSRERAANECERIGGDLVRITSQEENDFLSEWILHRHPDVLTLMTGGVGAPMGSRTVWMWDSSQFAVTYSNWWNGWDGGGPGSSAAGRCIVMSRVFACPTAQEEGGPPARCKTDYHFWTAHECSKPTHGAICKRNPNDIGCVWNLGMDYAGRANVTRHGNPCLPWDSGPFGSPHPDVRLRGHNKCRNHGGADGGSAAEGHPWCYVGATGSWESCEIPPCRGPDRERSAAGAGDKSSKQPCRPDEFDCGPECIPSVYACDGLRDCPDGRDEGAGLCRGRGAGVLKEFRRKGGVKHRETGQGLRPLEKWVQVSAKFCASQCLEKERPPHHCTAFSYHLKDQQCWLVADNKTPGHHSQPDLEKKFGWDHYQLLPPNVNCRGMFRCKNGTCINKNKVCNGMNDCGDRSDEVNCSSVSAAALDFDLRLVGGNVSYEGRIEVKAFGHWGVVCDDLFGLADADVVCRELGFALGASEAVLHSGFGSGVLKGPPVFLMDEVECVGTESSLSECPFAGWGHHNCGPEEVAGVVCKIPGSICQEDQFHCERSKECIPLEFLCDNLKDCKDGSDEEHTRCQSEVLVRLADGPSSLEGRVEVRYHGVWGTVCDDDFGVPDAQVICRSLGLGSGPGVFALKEAHYGPGKGPIWLDEMHCSGMEERVTDCPRFPWGKNNCGHREDASVKCTLPEGGSGGRRAAAAVPPTTTTPAPRIRKEEGRLAASAADILPTGCGLQANTSAWMRAFGLGGAANGGETHPDAAKEPRVTGGREVKLGPIPWQASLRVRTSPGKSVHWCGAVVLSPLLVLTAGHCIKDYSKEMYALRVGDYDSKMDEGTEQEVAIEEVYLHEEFNKGPYLNNDIALLKLKAPPGIRFDEHVHAACLPGSAEGGEWGSLLPLRGAVGGCIISGWGSVGNGIGFSRTLRSAAVPLLNQSVCRAPHVYGADAISDGMGCAGSLSEGGADACQGDSGGPLVCFGEGNRPILFGITSWGQGCGRTNKPGVYSRISFYREWINKKVQEAMSGM